jgi:hypothetical protein
LYEVEVHEGTPTDVGENKSPVEMPTEYSLRANYPNPFNPSTSITFYVPKTSDVSVTVYNSLGMEVETLVSRSFPPGRHEVTFHAGNLSSGVYFYRMTAGIFSSVRRMMLLR